MDTATKEFTLTQDQQSAMDAFQSFLMDPLETVFVLSGYSGCGKSTLVKTLLDRIPAMMKAARLINPSQKDYAIELTATTNKAAENLSQITGSSAGTIHSFLELRLDTNYMTGESKLIPRSKGNVFENYLLFIDEASYVDKPLMEYIFSLTKNCKIVFIGDPAQLTPVKYTHAPVFAANFNGAALTQVVRQAEGNPIVDLSTKFRYAVNTGEFFRFKPDGHHVRHMDKASFNQALLNEFTRPDWTYSDSKILGWTNKCVLAYNAFIQNHIKGDPEFHEGDYAICNEFCMTQSLIGTKGSTLKTEQMVHITAITTPNKTVFGVLGDELVLDGKHLVFHPKSLQDKKLAIKAAELDKDFNKLRVMRSEWVDLRAAYACTINKAQGSTYNSVYIDLDDVSRCNSGDQIARMLYVAVSRARDHVYLTGDFS